MWLPRLSRWWNRRHRAVRSLQEWLTEVGYRPGPVDGVFGKRTEAAVIALRRDSGLVDSGKVHGGVWKALHDLLAAQRAYVEPAPVDDFVIVPRTDWGARPAKQTAALLKTRPTVYVHHAADPRPVPALEDSEARKFQNYHMGTKGWWDVAYNFLITPTGRILEGRGLGIRSGATRGQNAQSYSICFMGFFHDPVDEEPSDVSIRAAGWLIRELIDGEWVVSDPAVIGHRDSPTARTTCPGNNLYSRLPDIRLAAGMEPQ